MQEDRKHVNSLHSQHIDGRTEAHCVCFDMDDCFLKMNGSAFLGNCLKFLVCIKMSKNLHAFLLNS